MKKLIFTLLISLFALNAVAQEENASSRYELAVWYDRGTEGIKLDTQTGKMWLLIENKDSRDKSISRQQYTINTQVLSTEKDQSKPGRYTFASRESGGLNPFIILDKISGKVYYLLKGSTYNNWKLVPF